MLHSNNKPGHGGKIRLFHQTPTVGNVPRLNLLGVVHNFSIIMRAQSVVLGRCICVCGGRGRPRCFMLTETPATQLNPHPECRWAYIFIVN